MAADHKAFRRYQATIERALTLFDPNSDWADYIAFLTRLLKSLETNKPDGITDVPCKTRIALCLSRCLQPTLPSGVHQKALDVYLEIFMTIGIGPLSHDLPVWLPGLSHTLAFANLTTRPLILNLYESYVLKLPTPSLRPALKALLLSLLPVIEEETSEDFDSCMQTFDSLRTCFAQDGQESFFWQTLFMASVSNPHRRAGVLVYLGKFLPKLTSNVSHQHNDESVIVKPEPGLLVRCFATGLRDDQPLIQRGFLDLLVTHLPLDASVLQSASYRKDLDVLVSAALTVTLRRDMGLNRRLWSWCTGIDAKPKEMPVTSPLESPALVKAPESSYFTRFALQSTIRSISQMLEESKPSSSIATLPYRIGSSLMDRWEIGEPVVKACFLPMMQSLMAYQSTAPSQEAFDEVFRSASSFFDSVESQALFSRLSESLQSEQLELLTFIMSNFNIEQIENVHFHLSALCVEVVDAMGTIINERHALSILLNDLTILMPPLALMHQDEGTDANDSKLLDAVNRCLSSQLDDLQDTKSISFICSAFERSVMLTTTLETVRTSPLLQNLRKIVSDITASKIESYPLIDIAARVCISLLARRDILHMELRNSLLDFLPFVITALWPYLSPSMPQYHVSTVESIANLSDLTLQEEVVSSVILKTLTDESMRSLAATSHMDCFGVLYHHTKTVKRSKDDIISPLLHRPTLYLLDTCLDEDPDQHVIQWLSSLQDITPIFKLVFDTDLNESQDLLLTLRRVKALTNLLSKSDDQWRGFSNSLSLPLVHGLCLTLLDQYRTDGVNHIPDALALFRQLYGPRSNNVAPDELVIRLIDKIEPTITDAKYQEEVLDTLLAILNDKIPIPSNMVPVLLQGLSSIYADERLDKCITLLCNVLPNQTMLLPSLLKATEGFCKRIISLFEGLQSLFLSETSSFVSKNPERSIANLLSGLEYILARAHQTVSQNMPTTNGHFPGGTDTEKSSSRSRANDRLTVVLCMQDAVRICTTLWAWKNTGRNDKTLHNCDTKSFNYTAMRLRTRCRKILENLIDAEPQECLETLIGIWTGPQQVSVLDLLQTLNGARPRVMLPSAFNAIYSRTNPGALSSTQKSTITIQLTPLEIVSFLLQYTTALEDDMLEEIWTDCAAFLREVLSNPMPHRQLLIKLLRFCSVLARKMDNTSFSEQSRMHRELSDLCARLFTAIFTIKPIGFDGLSDFVERTKTTKASQFADDNMLSILTETLPHLNTLLSHSDRLNGVHLAISTNITSPALHSRNFPLNLNSELLSIVRLIAVSSGTVKPWKKDVIDSFGNPKFFSSTLALGTSGWLPLLKQLQLSDKSLFGEILARIAPPAAAGIVLGIGAAAARNEADRKTQLDLRRLTTLILSADFDTVLPNLQQVLQKIEELFGATVESSPSLASRDELYLLIRAILLNVGHTNLTQFWPLLTSELQALCKDILAGSESKYTPVSKLQGAKLLDLLLLLRPDEFQLHEWLFVTDTIDAIYPSTDASTVAYADEMAQILNTGIGPAEPHTPGTTHRRKPWLYGKSTRTKDANEVNSFLSAFFGQLSIRVFEDVYSLHPLDLDACRQDLLTDVFTDTTTGGGKD